MTDAVSHLIHEHQDCNAKLTVAEAAMQRLDWPLARDAFGQAEALLLSHFRQEEAVLFPAFESATGMTQGPTKVMRDEHAVIRDLLENCRSQLQANDSEGFLAELDTLVILLQQHHVKEENVLYPMCRAHVPALDQLMAAPPALP